MDESGARCIAKRASIDVVLVWKFVESDAFVAWMGVSIFQKIHLGGHFITIACLHLKSFHIFCDVNASLILNKTDKRLEITLHHALAIGATSGRNIALLPPTVQALPIGDEMCMQGRIIAFHVMIRIADSVPNPIFRQWHDVIV